MSDAAASESKPSAPGKKRVLILGVAALVLAGACAAAFFTFKGGDEATGKAKVAEAEAKLPAQFVALEPPFVVNFEAGSSARFLQIAVQLMTRDESTVKTLQTLNPIIRNDLLLLFGNKTVQQVSTQEGKEALRQAALESIRKILGGEGAKPEALEAVYFTSFVMQ